MDACCEDRVQDLMALHGRQRRVLLVVFALNAAMFGVEFASGWIAHSAALTADSLDMFGDALIFAMSLHAVGRGARWQTGIALVKGAAMTGLGLAVLGQIVHTLWLGRRPLDAWMGGVGTLALAANVACLWLLTRHRQDDLNLRSAWTCARNDVLSNLGVLVAAAGVWLFDSPWPDALVGAAIAALILSSAVRVLRDGLLQWRGGTVAGLGHAHHHHHGHAHGQAHGHGAAQ